MYNLPIQHVILFSLEILPPYLLPYAFRDIALYHHTQIKLVHQIKHNRPVACTQAKVCMECMTSHPVALDYRRGQLNCVMGIV